MILNNSSNYGHTILDNALGLNFSFSNRNLRNSRFSLEYSFPIYQSFNGLQVGNISNFNLNLQYSPGGHKKTINYEIHIYIIYINFLFK